jgi:SEFIR domain
MLNQVFLSYRHESLEHAQAVLRLGKLLRQAKIPVALDQFYLYDNPGGPDEGWPKWCEDCANKSACVLIVASEGWFAIYERREAPGIGCGAAAEAALFQQYLYDEKGENPRIRLAFLHQVAADKVPVRLRAWHRFQPFDADSQLDQLIRWVGKCCNFAGVL